jgi:hypothetical protein
MSPKLIKQLSRYRSLAIALANAAVTWVILIIAPLGLFAVITCTVLVFASSLLLGVLGDMALTLLLRDSTPPSMSGGRPLYPIDFSYDRLAQEDDPNDQKPL